MRIDVKKFLFFGLRKDKAAFFKQAQELGSIHFIALKEKSHNTDSLISAIKVLRDLPIQPQESISDPFTIAERVLKLKARLAALAEEQQRLKVEIERVAPFGDFSWEEAKRFNRTLQFFYGAQPSVEMIFVASEHNRDYYIAFNKEPKQYEGMVEMQILEPLGTLQKHFQSNADEIANLDQELLISAKYKISLQQALAQELDSHTLTQAEESAMALEGDLFAAIGWIAVTEIDKLDALTIHAEEIAADKEEIPPTYLENEGLHRIGEDLVDIYDTPSQNDRDPSLWVFLSFALFFGMILGDAGYGLIFLLATLFIRGLPKRTWTLFFILSCACIFWGTMAHSFFGISIGPDNPLRKFSLLHYLEVNKANYLHISGQESKLADGILLEISLLVGILHLTLSFLRYLDRNWSGAGWILFMFGSYLYFPAYLKTKSMVNYLFDISVEQAASIGIILIYAGITLAFLLGFIRERIWGLLQAMNLIQVFGDVLSYLRLYALGLAGSVVMTTINDFAAALPIFFGVLLFILGHAVNMVLGIMGGFIHGLRLNFIEWYHYSFEGGGKKFNPLKKGHHK